MLRLAIKTAGKARFFAALRMTRRGAVILSAAKNLVVSLPPHLSQRFLSLRNNSNDVDNVRSGAGETATETATTSQFHFWAEESFTFNTFL